MPWSLERREEGWCVIKESDGSSAGCHDSRADAIKQQRALYANESRMASMYAELDSQPDPEPEPILVSSGSRLADEVAGLLLKEDPLATELVGKLLKEDREHALIASVAQSQSLIASQMQRTYDDRQALVAALERMSSPTFNIPAPEVTVNVPETVVNVPAAEITVNVPDVNVTVDAPHVTVRPEIVMPAPAQKTVTFERDPLTQQVVKAEVTEA